MGVLNSRQRLKLSATILIFTFLLAWWLRVIPGLLEAPLQRNYTAFQDWTRVNLIQTGHLGKPDGLTARTQWAGGGNYKFNNYTTAILNIVSGTTGVQPGIQYLRLIPIGLTVPAFACAFYQRASHQLGRLTTLSGYVTVCVFSLFPTGAFISRTASIFGQHLVVITLGLVLLLAIGRYSRRGVALLLLLLFVSFNLHHTTAMVTMALVGGYFVIETALTARHDPKTARLYLSLGLTTGILFFLVGTTLNGRFSELIGYPVQLIDLSGGSEASATNGTGGGGSTTSFREMSVETFRESLAVDLGNLKRIARILSKIVFRGGHALLIGAFIFGTYKQWKRSRQQLRLSLTPTERVLATILPLFVLIFAVFFSYQGIAGGIIRTQNSGVIFSIPILAVIVVRNRWPRRTVALVALIVLASMTGAVTSFQYSTTGLTDGEADGIEFVGKQVPEDRLVFSDQRVNTPLVYYGHRGLVMVELSHPNWQTELETIFYGDNVTAADEAINRTIQRSLVKRTDAGRKVYDSRNRPAYLLISMRSSEFGISISSFILDKPDRIALTKFGRTRHRIYDNGVTHVYM